MEVYRICREPFAALDGEGARLYGGRWNSPGRPAVYTGTSRALAALEYLVHLDPSTVPDDLVLVTIDLPDDVRRETIDHATLPLAWNHVAAHPACQDQGDAWLTRSSTAALEVPSAPVPEERNIVLNVRHGDFGRVVEVDRRPFVFDPRLLS